jgi:hypothetical protein
MLSVIFLGGLLDNASAADLCADDTLFCDDDETEIPYCESKTSKIGIEVFTTQCETSTKLNKKSFKSGKKEFVNCGCCEEEDEAPDYCSLPSAMPSVVPTAAPSATFLPSEFPSEYPSDVPSATFLPSEFPSEYPSDVPSATFLPSSYPSGTFLPSSVPSDTSAEPTGAFCVDLIDDDTCGLDSDDVPKVPYCVVKVAKKDGSDTFKTGCDTVEKLEKKVGSLKDTESIESCGCCTTDQEENLPGYCPTYRCGEVLADLKASKKCAKKGCPTGDDSECDDGETCFEDVICDQD